MANLCHYCGGKAGTRDHIVPRCLIERPHVPVAAVTNIVHACERCNQLKGWARAACTCLTCCAAWSVYGPIWNQVRHRIPVIDVRALALAQDTATVSLEALAVPA